MYGKIFESIFSSTLVADGGWLPTYIFMSMITIADKDGVVDIAPKALFYRLGFREYDNKITYKDFEAAIEYLCQSDPYSHSQKELGKRIIPISKIPEMKGNRGWLVVNYMEYRSKASKTEPSGSSTERVRQYRERQKNKDLEENETVMKRDVTKGNGHTDTDTDTDINKHTSNSDESDWTDFWTNYPRKEAKKKSRTAFLNLTKDKRRKAVEDSKTRYNGVDKRFIPLATTYIHGERWEDEKLFSESSEDYLRGAI